MPVKNFLMSLAGHRRGKVPDTEDVQTRMLDGDHRLTNLLPLVGGDALPVFVPNDLPHRGSRFVTGGGVDIGILLAVHVHPKDGDWIVIWTGGRP